MSRKTSLFRSGFFNILFQIILLLVLFFFGRERLIPDEPSLRFLILLALVGVPSMVWALFFYLQDRLEPEPISHVAMAFLSGMTAAALFAIPTLFWVLRVDDWIYTSTALFILGSYFLLAMVFSLLIFFILHVGFYPLKEFDEPADGMVYGATAGCGYAFVSVFYYLQTHPETTLFVAGYKVTTQVLIYSGVAAMIGYMFGKAKFSRRKLSLLGAIALVVGILLLGTHHLFTEFIFVSGYTHAFWISFGFTTVYAGFILGFCYRKIRKLVESGRRRQMVVRARPLPSVLVITMVLLLIGAGISIYGLRGKQFSHPEWRVSFHYPHRLVPFSFTGMSQSLSARDTRFKMLFCGQTGTPSRCQISLEVGPEFSSANGMNAAGYTPAGDKESMVIVPIAVGGQRGRRIAYSILSPDLESPYEFPRLTQVLTDVIQVSGRVFVFSMKAPIGDFEDSIRCYEKLLKSVRWQAPAGEKNE